MRSFTLGSVAYKTLHLARIPVTLVPGGDRGREPVEVGGEVDGLRLDRDVRVGLLELVDGLVGHGAPRELQPLVEATNEVMARLESALRAICNPEKVDAQAQVVGKHPAQARVLAELLSAEKRRLRLGEFPLSVEVPRDWELKSYGGEAGVILVAVFAHP